MLTNDDLKKIGDVMDAKLDERLGEVLEAVNSGFTVVESRMVGLESRMTAVESKMVTKEYLDDKLADLRSEFRFVKTPR